MAHSTEKLAAQSGGRGFFAEISLDATLDQTNQNLVVSFSDEFAKSFREAAHFGIAYAWEQYPSDKKHRRGLNVHVIGISWQPVDTASVLVAFVACRAIWRALGWNPLNGPSFDERLGAVIFPKRI